MFACQQGSVEICQLLVNKDAQINVQACVWRRGGAGWRVSEGGRHGCELDTGCVCVGSWWAHDNNTTVLGGGAECPKLVGWFDPPDREGSEALEYPRQI